MMFIITLVSLLDNMREQLSEVWDVQSGPDASVIARSDSGRGDGLCDADGFCEKKIACYIWTDHLLYCFETKQYVCMLSLYHSAQ